MSSSPPPSLLSRLDRNRVGKADRDAHPWIRVLENAGLPPDGVPISTNALAVILGVKASTGNARRIAVVMRKLGFQPLLSRGFFPGGWRDTVSRGWVRPKPIK